MYEIEKDFYNEYIVNKSRFICLLFKISNIIEINDLINKTKKNYKGATHYCYAYIIDNKEKCSDDGEPAGTAGVPILNILQKNNLTNILCVVVRYFGGIKLGAGGLIRAYSSAVNETLKLVNIRKYIEYKIIKISTNYENIKTVEYKLKKYEILDKNFSDNIKITLKVPLTDLNFINNLEKNNIIKVLK